MNLSPSENGYVELFEYMNFGILKTLWRTLLCDSDIERRVSWHGWIFSRKQLAPYFQCPFLSFKCQFWLRSSFLIVSHFAKCVTCQVAQFSCTQYCRFRSFTLLTLKSIFFKVEYTWYCGKINTNGCHNFYTSWNGVKILNDSTNINFRWTIMWTIKFSENIFHRTLIFLK